MSTDKNGGAANEDARTRDRSPPFPFISLEKAIDRAKEFEAHYKRAPGRVANVLPVWKYTQKSSGGLQTVGALRQFGLVEDEGSGRDRKIKLSDLAYRILKDERPGNREEAIREAALTPKSLLEHWEIWGQTRPPDAECRSELTLERGYTEDAAKRFLRVYDDTIAFAGLKESDKIQDNQDAPLPIKQSITGSGVLIGSRPVVKGTGSITTPMTGHLQDVFNVAEGQAVVQWPAAMSKDSFEDFEQWLEIIKRKIKRQIDSADADSPAAPNEEAGPGS